MLYLPLLATLMQEQHQEGGLPPGDAYLENLQLGHHQVRVSVGANSKVKYEKVLYVVCVSALAPHVRLI